MSESIGIMALHLIYKHSFSHHPPNHPPPPSHLPNFNLHIQRLLPKITPSIRRRIPDLRDPRDIQVLHRSVLAIHDEIRHPGLVRRARLGEMRDVLLQRDGDGGAEDGGGGPVEVGVSTCRKGDRQLFESEVGGVWGLGELTECPRRAARAGR